VQKMQSTSDEREKGTDLILVTDTAESLNHDDDDKTTRFSMNTDSAYILVFQNVFKRILRRWRQSIIFSSHLEMPFILRYSEDSRENAVEQSTRTQTYCSESTHVFCRTDCGSSSFVVLERQSLF
jgi:hypothetical protein